MPVTSRQNVLSQECVVLKINFLETNPFKNELYNCIIFIFNNKSTPILTLLEKINNNQAPPDPGLCPTRNRTSADGPQFDLQHRGYLGSLQPTLSGGMSRTAPQPCRNCGRLLS